MELTDEISEKLTQLEFKKDLNHHNSTGIIYIDENKLYKIVNSQYFFPKEFERNIDYLINNNIPNTPKIYEKIYLNKEFYGYVAEYIKDGLTFREAINNDVNINEKNRIKAIIDIHKTLKTLHANNILLGDIHLDNFLIKDNHGYIIDLDYMRFIGEEFKFATCYDIKRKDNTNKITFASVYTDIVKTMLTSISLLIRMDLESLISKKEKAINLEYIYNTIIMATNNQKLIAYFKKIMDGEEIYFDDFLIESGYYKEEIKTL